MGVTYAGRRGGAAGSVKEINWPDWENETFAPWQHDFLCDDNTRKIINAGRGAGKDRVSIFGGVRDAIELWHLKRQICPVNRRGDPRVTVSIVAPTEKNYLPSWRKLKSIVPYIPGFAADGKPNYNLHQREHTIELFGENELFFTMQTAYNPDSLRGDGWDITIVTEAGLLEWDTFKLILKLCNRSDYHGALTLNSTPPHDLATSWWHDACRSAKYKLGSFEEFSYYHATSFDNPLLTPKNRLRIFKEMADDVKLFLVERMARLDVVLQGGTGEHPIVVEELQRCMVDAYPGNWGGPNGYKIVSYDLAWGGSDSFVETTIDVVSCFLERIQCWDKTATAEPIQGRKYDPEAVKRRTESLIIPTMIKAHQRHGGNCKIVYDATGPAADLMQYLLPPYLNAEPIKMSPTKKPGVIQNFLQRVTRTASGEAQAFLLPNPETFPFADTEQRDFVRRFFTEASGFVVETLQRPWGTYIWYHKGRGFADDILDSTFNGVSKLPELYAPIPLNRDDLSLSMV
jgi:hypothetical protein